MRKFILSMAAEFIALIAFSSQPIYADSAIVNSTKPLPQDGKMHVYFCGTGVPIVYMQYARKPACLAIIVDNQFLLFDAGEGAIQTISAMGLPYTRIYNVFMTHWHSDHFAGLAQVANESWVDGRQQPMNVYGPYGVYQILNSLKKAYNLDTIFRSINSDNSLDPSLATPVPHLIDAIYQDKKVYQKDNLVISAFEVDHAPVYPALGYRLQYKSCHLTISGDTKVIPKEAIEAKNADLFISEALNLKQTNQLAAEQKAAGNMTKYKIYSDILHYHSDTIQLAQLAQQVGVKNLILTHLDPPFLPNDQKAKAAFIEGMQQYYKNPLMVANDGDEVTLTPSADGSCKVEVGNNLLPAM